MMPVTTAPVGVARIAFAPGARAPRRRLALLKRNKAAIAAAAGPLVVLRAPGIIARVRGMNWADERARGDERGQGDESESHPKIPSNQCLFC